MNLRMNNSTEGSDDVLNGKNEIEESKMKNRRNRNVSEWNREKRKRLRIAGKEYVNTKGELIRPRKIGTDCECRRKCYTKVNGKERERLFDNYYSLPSHDEQNAHLFKLIRKHDIARRRSKGSEKRTCTFKYFVSLKNGKEIHVCRQAFCHIHAISAHKVRLLCEKLDRNISYPRDERGRHSNRPTRIPDNTISTIEKHILALLRSDRLSDFVKDDKQAKTQTGVDLNITKMWRDFLIEHRKASSTDIYLGDEWSGASVKLWLYNKVFHSVVSKETANVSSERLNGIKENDKGGAEADNNRRSGIELISASASEKAPALPQNPQILVPAAHSSDQSSFLLCGVIDRAQYCR